MSVPAYVPGDWFAVVADGSVALLPAATPAIVVQKLWEALSRGARLADQLQVLLNGGIASLPPFALVSVEGGSVRVVVRGEADVIVATGAGPRVLSAPNVSTWSEEVVVDAASVTVRAPGWDGAVGDALPIAAGIVRAGGVLLDLQVGGGVATEVVRRATLPEVVRGATVSEVVATVEPAAGSSVVAGGSAMTSVLAVAPEPVLVPELVPELDQAPVLALVPVLVRAPMLALVPLQQSEPVTPEDHDGMTVLSSDVVALRRQMPAWVGDAMPGPLAVPAAQAPAPAKMHLSTGLVVTLNRSVLLGRAPQVSRAANSEIPRLVTVASPNQDISRTHAEVRMDGTDVLVTDLHSTNGVILLVAGTGPRRLHPGEPAVVDPGVTVDLGEGITFTVERGA
ncbi:MAG: FHA domain-containing protein [Cellulomonas sp.]|nr:FHA domain-containing protein [Cellulomonas sp.]